jgi:hypothetical protein
VTFSVNATHSHMFGPPHLWATVIRDEVALGGLSCDLEADDLNYEASTFCSESSLESTTGVVVGVVEVEADVVDICATRCCIATA